jgi:hypothetical protein
MNMPSNLKKMIRARMEKTGESYQTARRHVRGIDVGSGDASSTTPKDPDIVAILREFRVGHISSIEIRRRRGARSADRATAVARAASLAADPVWTARSDSFRKTIKRPAFDVLKKLGATEQGTMQRIVVRDPSDAPLSFSVQCAKCHLWINCRDSERDEKCLCGQAFSVVFENTPEWTPEQLEAVRFNRCAGCGGEFGLYPQGHRLGQWNPLTRSMAACADCVETDHVNRWRGSASAAPTDDDLESIANTLYSYEIGSAKGTVRAGTAFLAVLRVLADAAHTRVQYDDVEWALAGDTCAQGRFSGLEASATLAG